MLPRESIKDMYMCFIKKFNNFKSLEKTYINEEMVEKVLWCCLRNKWGLKVIAIEESQDLKIHKLDDLVWKLLSHEIRL